MDISSVLSRSVVFKRSEKAGISKADSIGRTSEMSENEKLEAFKKEVWNEINRMPWNPRINTSIRITDEGFKRMMNDPTFKDKTLSLIGEDARVGRYPITSLMINVDGNGYSGRSYNFGYGQEDFEAHAKDKDS